jgi:atypical dual specificity phosphatase
MHDARYDLEALRSVGVTRLISLTEPAFDASLAHEFGIRCLTSPMPDMAPPTLPQGVALCETIDLALAAKEVVAVHCLAGLGRTGTVLTAYWLWCNRGSVSALSALEYVRQIEPGWVQSDAQVKFLEIFALVVANSDARVAALTYDSNSAPDVAVFEL